MLIYLSLKVTKGWPLGKMPYKTWLLACLLVLMPWMAHAAGLGKLTILSALGQPLLAEIDLVSVRGDEAATLTARLASSEAFAQANVQYNAALASVRMSVERRADGSSYIKIISTRSINDPFIDLLVELSWAQGRLVREYTALIDPPGYTPGGSIVQVAPPVVAEPAATPESQPIAPATPQASVPVEATPAVEAPVVTRPVAAPAKAEIKEYGPVKRGETLSKIAASVKPEGVTLEQMLVSLYRSNPDAFVGNMNRLKTGKILRIPEKEQAAETSQTDAVKEVRVQAANWNAYRQKLAEAAGETPAQERKTAASGKITTAVDDKAAGKEAPREVLKLSKGEPAASGKAGSGKGAPRTAAERMHVLEEEAIARQQAIAKGNDRIAQLEKNITDMQRLLEVKGQLPGAVAAKPVPQPALAAGGVLLALLGGAGYWFVRRRRTQVADDEDRGEKTAPKLGKAAAATPAMAATVLSAPAGGGEDVDPLAEAALYLKLGRIAQAEEVLTETLGKNPSNEEAQLKLLQIYTATLDPDLKFDLGGDTAAPLAPEFKLDDINLNLDHTTETVQTKAPQAEDGAKDDHWYDMQTKFDLAKAYQEMGDEDGTREILQEVIEEGDAGQRAEAKKLLDSLG